MTALIEIVMSVLISLKDFVNKRKSFYSHKLLIVFILLTELGFHSTMNPSPYVYLFDFCFGFLSSDKGGLLYHLRMLSQKFCNNIYFIIILLFYRKCFNLIYIIAITFFVYVAYAVKVFPRPYHIFGLC